MKYAITTIDPVRQSIALQLAEELNLDFIADPADVRLHGFPFVLILTADYLGLYEPAAKKNAPFYIDFFDKALAYRQRAHNLRAEYLIRAIGVLPSERPFVIDATAGLGRDSFLLASAGYEVVMLERSPIMYALLRDAMQRAVRHPDLRAIIGRMKLIQADATLWLKQNALPRERKSIIYLDPMFPVRQKAAAVKKEMVLLQKLLGQDEGIDILFNQAIACTTFRVVVKRPRLSAPVGDRVPNFTLIGKSSRFDVYSV